MDRSRCGVVSVLYDATGEWSCDIGRSGRIQLVKGLKKL